MAAYQHGTTDRLWYGEWVTVIYKHPIPFWRAIHANSVRLGANEGGCSYRVGEDLYVQAHNGSEFYHFVIPYHFAGWAVDPWIPEETMRCADCGAVGELTGHQTCQYPRDHE